MKNSVLTAYWKPTHFSSWYGDIDEGGLDYFACFYRLKTPLQEDDYGFDVSMGDYVAVSIVVDRDSLPEADRALHDECWEHYRVGEVDANYIVHVPAWVENGKFVCSLSDKRVILADANEFQCRRYAYGWWEDAVGYNPYRFSRF